MSQEHVELAHQCYDAFNRGDLDALLTLMDADVEANSRLVAMEGGYHGHDGIRRWWGDLREAMPDLTIEVVEVRDLGDLMVTAFRIRGHGAGSDFPVDQLLWAVIQWRDKKVVWWSHNRTEAEALETVGLRE